MCSRFSVSSKPCSKALSKHCKAGLVSLLLLFFAVSSAWAWFPASTAKATQDPLLVVVHPETTDTVQEEKSEMPSTASSESNEKPLSAQLEEFQNQLNSSKKVSNDIKDQFDQLMTTLAKYFALEDAEDAIEEENSKKLDEISAMLKKEQGTKLFATVGCLVGFEDGIDLGISSTFGIRFGKGLIASAGLQYMFGPVNNMEFTMDKSKLQAVASIGWEW